MSNKSRTGYVVRYALTKGIQQVELRPFINPEYVKIADEKFGLPLKLGVDAFWSRIEARAAALEKRNRKVAQLHAQIAKLEALTFTEVTR